MKYLLVIGFLTIIAGCETESSDADNSPSGNNSGGEWLIPADEIFDGGPGKDGIPALEDPAVSPSSGSLNDYLKENDLILSLGFSGNKRAYPHPVLDWHEIINDEFSDRKFAVNYCPLTGTGMAWKRVLNNETTTFGVSGLLYNTNLILYDRLTDSYWSQMSLMSVKGQFSGKDAEILSMVEMKWKTWKELYPDAEVITPPENYSRPYGSYPYGNYKTDNDYLLFPVSIKDNRLPQKERVLAVVGDKENARVYRFNENPGKYIFIRDNFFQKEYVVAGISNDFLVAYKEKTTDGDSVELSLVKNNLPVLFTDKSGTQYDVFGYAINGPGQGKKLEYETFITGFWFTFPSFFTNVEIYSK